ncbi:MAG: ABC transporter ATP-binding protein [Nitrospira sp.]|nr:ABC transporter ATP-binding protein [Candidatus Manganitrophaceae bacterium]HIL34802.1 ABC transporter ATP-binding protein [Candidatus Manganitrophaceae bacterium]
MANKTIIELLHVSRQYKNSESPAIHDISFHVEKGKVLALLGPSGSGKTTLLRLIAGFEAPNQGKIFLEGREVSRPRAFVPPEQRGVGMVFQDYALFPHLNVSENVVFGLSHLSRRDQSRKEDKILELVGLSSLRHRYPHELSGGQQQRVALARALAPDPIVLLMDEPFSNLDPDMRTQMQREVSSILEKTGSTAILVTHDHEEAFAMADQIALLNEGVLEQCDTPEVIYHTPATPFVADFVGKADFIPGTVRDHLITTEIGTFPNKVELPPGTEVMVMIRPDDIDLIPNPRGENTLFKRQFRGSENVYRILLPSGQVLHSSQHSLTVYPDQTRVELKLKVTHTVIFEKKTDVFEKDATGRYRVRPRE